MENEDLNGFESENQNDTAMNFKVTDDAEIYEEADEADIIEEVLNGKKNKKVKKQKDSENKKTINKRILAIIIAAVVALTTAVIVLFNIFGSQISKLFKDDTIMTINDYKVSEKMYSYFFENMKYQFDNGTEGYWTEDKAEQFDYLKESATNLVKRYYVPQIMADQLGIKLEDEDYTSIDETINDSIVQSGGQEGFNKALEDMHIDYDTYKFIISMQILDQKVYEYYYGENGIEKADKDKIFEYINTNYVLVKHILIKLPDETTDTTTEEDTTVVKTKEDALTKAQMVLDKVNAGEDFDTLISEYNDDPGMDSYPEGYFFTKNQMAEEFEQKAFEMQAGTTSDIVETKYGYHILKKYDLTDYYSNNTSELDEIYYSYLFGEKVTAFSEGLTVNFKKIYDNINMSSVD